MCVCLWQMKWGETKKKKAKSHQNKQNITKKANNIKPRYLNNWIFFYDGRLKELKQQQLNL